MSGTAKFSMDRKYRWELHRRWDMDESGLIILWIMLNPSTADEHVNDRTISRCIDFSKRWGYSGLMIGNLYGLRTPKPTELFKHPDPLGKDNDFYLGYMIASANAILVAWGSDAELERARTVHDMIRQRSKLQPMCLAMNEDGMPRHPLYVRAETEPVTWNPPGGL